MKPALPAAGIVRGPRPGHWMVRCCRHCPSVAARIWFCDHEPGDELNKVDQPYLQGQIGLDLIAPGEIWAMLEFCEATPAEQRAMAEPPMSDRVPRNGRHQAFQTAPMAKWRQERARRISAPEYEQQIARLRWVERVTPDDPTLSYRKPAVIHQVPIPF